VTSPSTVHCPPSTTLAAADVHLDVGQVYLALFLQRGLDLADLVPVSGRPATAPAAVQFHLALAVHAGRADRQGVQAGHRNLLGAAIAQTVGALLELRRGPVDLPEFLR